LECSDRPYFSGCTSGKLGTAMNNLTQFSNQNVTPALARDKAAGAPRASQTGDPADPSRPAAAQAAEDFDALLHELTLSDDAAELRHLVELCRHSLRIRAWLFGRFANDPATQSAFRALLSDPSGTAAHESVWSPVLQRQVLSKPGQPGEQPGRFGGLTEARILALIKRYQAGRIDGTVFFFVRCWLRFLASGRTAVPVALWRPTLQQWAAIMSDGTGRLAHHVASAVKFFHERSDRTIGEADFGYTHSWKIHLLLFILEHPRTCYRVSELRDQLPEKFRGVDRKSIREFCQAHGIQRDVRAGPPRTSWRRTAAKSLIARGNFR
jgi:hypothetical protein